MLIDVANLRMQPGQTSRHELAAKLNDIFYAGDRLTFDAPVQLSLLLNNLGYAFQVEGEAKVDIRLKCARCLSPFVYHLETAFKGEFRHEKNIALTEFGSGDEDNFYLFSGNSIDLSDLVIESILLAMPMKAICSENCKGLCAVCGINLNDNDCKCQLKDIDPRFEVLKELIQTEGRKED